MKRFTTTIMILGALLVSACIPDERDNFMVSDSFGLTAKDLIQETSVHTGRVRLGLAKNGKGSQAGTLRVVSDEEKVKAALEAFNKENKTEYRSVPGSLVTWSDTEFHFGVADIEKDIILSWDPEMVASLIGAETNFVIPILIESDNLPTGKGRNFMVVHLNRSGIALAQSGIDRSIEKADVEKDPGGYQPPLQETITLDLNITNPMKGLGLNFPISLDTGNAPEGLLTLSNTSVSIAEGSVGGSFRVVLDKSKLLDEDGKLQEFPTYRMTLGILKDGMEATLDGEPFQIKGLSFGKLECTFTISWKETPLGLVITREWGYYSTTDASWSDFISGFTAGTDRNVALDDNYIYIAETNTSKHLWAISRSNPAQYRLLPVGTVKDEGTFYLCCPRVITNSNPAINGGKDVLAVSNMTIGDPTLYIYADGIDNDPAVMDLKTWASRRLGDTFTWWGTLQDGVLYFKDFESAAGTVTFQADGRTSGNMNLISRLVVPAENGAGAYFPFPDNKLKGVASRRGGEKAWIASFSGEYMVPNTAFTPTLTELSGYYADTAFRFFELGSNRFIAYTRQVATDDGRLFILKGELSDSWEDMLAARNVVYHAAIQNSSAAFDGAALEPDPSPKHSGNSGMDLDVRIIGNNAFIAVVKQNVGLSLFRLTNN